MNRREGKPQRFARAIRATDKSPFGRLGKHGIRESGKVAQHHQRNHPLPGRFYICTHPRLINAPRAAAEKLSESQRSMVAAKLANMKSGTRTDIEPTANLQEVSRAEAAEMLNVLPHVAYVLHSAKISKEEHENYQGRGQWKTGESLAIGGRMKPCPAFHSGIVN